MIVNCVVYQQGRKIAEIRPEDISDYIAKPDAFVWVALRDPTREEVAQMGEEFGLHPLAIEDACKGHQRPKVEEYGDCLFVVLHTIEEMEQDPADLLVGELHVLTGRNYVLSVRHRTQKGFTDVRARTEREPELLRFGSGYVLYALMDAVVDRYFPVVDHLSSELESIEESLFDRGSSRRKIQELYALKRRLMILQHAVQPLMEAVGKLYGGRVPQLLVGMQDYYRDVYDHLARIESAIESIREMLQTAISVNIAFISLAESEVTKRLAAWGALITVPTLIAGIYGMNFKHMPELDWAGGYAYAIVLMAIIDGLLYWRFKVAKWL
ncbi:MAG TPA: magnesium/cobalt transporter CorA [Casimicrobiaceae bacterium]|nr:magnesium/cobalt transporter CorA [Casimicrobiaceae bacterium]